MWLSGWGTGAVLRTGHPENMLHFWIPIKFDQMMIIRDWFPWWCKMHDVKISYAITTSLYNIFVTIPNTWHMFVFYCCFCCCFLFLPLMLSASTDRSQHQVLLVFPGSKSVLKLTILIVVWYRLCRSSGHSVKYYGPRQDILQIQVKWLSCPCF